MTAVSRAPTRHLGANKGYASKNIFYSSKKYTLLITTKCRVGRYLHGCTAPTRHFVVLSKVWFFILKNLVFKAYPLLAPKCRVGAGHGHAIHDTHLWYHHTYLLEISSLSRTIPYHETTIPPNLVLINNVKSQK